MISGAEALRMIDGGVRQARSDADLLDGHLQTASNEAMELKRQEADLHRQLAKLRLDHIAQAGLMPGFDEADRQAATFLEARQRELAELEEQIAAARRQEESVEQERKVQQDKVREAVEAVDAAQAATQKRLETTEEFRIRLERTKAADAVAKHAEEKATLAENNRAEKGLPYEADPLFKYLWERGFGTTRYRAGLLARFLDGWVTRLCGFDKARANYAMLLEIPTRLREHADRQRKTAEQEVEQLRSFERKAAEEDGIPTLRERVENEERVAVEIDQRLDELEKRVHGLMDRRGTYASGDDEMTKQSLEVLSRQMAREPLGQLRRDAEMTPTPEDNLVVERLAVLEDSEARLTESLQQHRATHQRQMARLAELEEVRHNFKRNRFDDIQSVFLEGPVVGTLLSEFLRGNVAGAELWHTLRRHHRLRRIQSSPDFGSIPFPGGGARVWRLPPSGGWSYGGGGGGISLPNLGGGGGGGGGFRTGGGF